MLLKRYEKVIKIPFIASTSKTDKFYSFSDISKTTVGSILNQIKNGLCWLNGHASKILPPEAANYILTELEL